MVSCLAFSALCAERSAASGTRANPGGEHERLRYMLAGDDRHMEALYGSLESSCARRGARPGIVSRGRLALLNGSSREGKVPSSCESDRLLAQRAQNCGMNELGVPGCLHQP